MASQQHSDLSRVILRDIYGDLSEKVVGCLLDFGRLTIAQLSTYSSIPIPIIRKALVPLIQNRFVLYWIDPDSPKVCHFYANTTQIINTLIIPKILSYITDSFPNSTNKPEIIKNLFAFGHIRVSDYLSGLSSKLEAELDGDSYEVERVKNELSKEMAELISLKFLIPLYNFDFFPPDDIYSQIFKTQLAKISKNKSETARQNEATDAAKKEFKTFIGKRDDPKAGLITEEALHEKLASSATVNGNGKIPTPSLSANRRVRRNVSLAAPKLVVDPDTILSVNFDKFLVIFRNNELASIAEKTVGKVSALVYRALLKCYEGKLLRCRQDVSQDSEFQITTMMVINNFDPSIDIKSSIIQPKYNNGPVKRPIDAIEEEDEGIYDESTGSYSNKRQKTSSPFVTDDPQDGSSLSEFNDSYNSFIVDDADMYSNGSSNTQPQQISASDINKHLELIAASPLKLLVKAGNRGGGEWYVPFDDLRDTIRQLKYDEIIQNKFGPSAVRILRIIREKGMANEELLARTALLRQNTIYNLTNQLHKFGALSLQEVPRSADRAPTKTIFMWFHSPKRAYGLVEEYLCQTLTRLLQRVQSERSRHPVLLSKLEREDVKQNEDLYLTTQEKMEIAQLRQAEERLLVQVSRVQSLCQVFSHY